MSDEFNALVSLGSASEVKILKANKALPASLKKESGKIHAPSVKEGFTRLFPSFYEVNHKNEIDKTTRKKIKEKETFTRFLQPAGQEKTAIFTTREIYFIPLEFKFSRSLYLGAYNPNEKRAPDCQSQNGIVPQTPKFAKSCDECPYSKWVDKTPPKCSENPELLILDMTAKTIKDPEQAAAVTAEAVTITFSKSAIRNVKDLMKKLAEPVLFDDGSYGQIDMTQFVVKATLEVGVDGDGKETAYCTPVFEIVGQVPFEVSEKLIESINTPVPSQGGKTPLQLFLGRTEPMTDSEVAEIKKTEVEQEAQPKVQAAPPPVKKEVQTVDVQPDLVEDGDDSSSSEEDDEELAF